MTFARKMLEAQKKLQGVGHAVVVPWDTELHLMILISSMILIKIGSILSKMMFCEKDSVPLMNLKKKIYLLFNPPSPQEARWAHEVLSIKPIILGGDLVDLT